MKNEVLEFLSTTTEEVVEGFLSKFSETEKEIIVNAIFWYKMENLSGFYEASESKVCEMFL